MIWILFGVTVGVALWATAAVRTYAIPRERGWPLARGAGVIAALLLVVGLRVHDWRPRLISSVASRSNESQRWPTLDNAAFDRRFEAGRAGFDREFAARRRAFNAERAGLDRQLTARRRQFEERRREFDRSFQRRRRESRREFGQARANHLGTVDRMELSGTAVARAATPAVWAVNDGAGHVAATPTASASVEQ